MHGVESVSRGNVSSFRGTFRKKYPEILNIFSSAIIGGSIICFGYVLYSSIEIKFFEEELKKGKTPKRVKEMPKTKFSDVKGCDEVKVELEEFVSYLKNPAKIARLGGRMPKGLLMVGSPGVGKTLLAKALAGEAGVPFYYVNASEFDGMFVGSGAKMIRELYEEARKNTPCVVFLDEIDSIGPMRLMGSGSAYTSRDTIDQLLAALDGFKSNEGILTIGATNFPQSLDNALTRPGRFDSKVTVGFPDKKGRIEILKLYISKVKMGETVDFDRLAQKLIGFNGADIANIVNQSALTAARQGKKAIMLGDLLEAAGRARNGKEQKTKKYTKANINTIATNQAGHALVALLTGREVIRVTVLPTGNSQGNTQLVPREHEHSVAIADLKRAIMFMVAGRVAEQVLREGNMQEMSTYSSNAMQNAFKRARHLIVDFGYSEKIGIITGVKKVSNETHTLIDEETERVVTECVGEATALLKQHKAILIKLQQLLVNKEALNGDDIDRLLPELKELRQAKTTDSKEAASIKKNSNTPDSNNPPQAAP